MRLINAATVRLERFDDDTKIPPYAILSHRWGDEEVDFQRLGEMHTGDESTQAQIKSMLGFGKIAKTCEVALKDGFAYAWVDTCCIDKTSSAELSEAINSMFRWYNNAQVCYAYLDDVPIDFPPEATVDLEPDWGLMASAEQLGKSRWFTRGWTLQELLAPSKVRFYGPGWISLGTKDLMLDQLREITGVEPEFILDSNKLFQASVAKRMSWAARRTTTRVEDIAYCLMGLFDVNMPLLYGEGKKAFVRLQEAILNQTEDQTLFAWTPLYASMTIVLLRTDGISIFAEHPSSFAPRLRLRPLNPQGDPSALTSRGVRISLPVLLLKNPNGGLRSTFLVVLYCNFIRYGGQPLIHPAILAHRLHIDKETHTYVRHATARIYEIRSEAILPSDVRQVYLRTQAEPDNRVQMVYKLPASMNISSSRPKFEEARVYEPDEEFWKGSS